MAITGIDTIDGKQIIAAGAVSAKSAEMAYNDENGNPITGYQVAGDYYSASNPSGFITGVDLTPYQTTAGMTAYQSAGDYLTTADSANFYTTANESGFLTGLPIDISVRDLNVSRHVRATVTGKDLYGNFDYAGMYFRSGSQRPYNIGIDNTGSNFYIATAKNGFERIYASSIQNWNGKLDGSASSNFYTTANESGFITGVPAGTMNESAFGYDSDNKISSYNGSAFAGGSTPAYGYTDNGLISSIDTSGLYATSGSANHLNHDGTMSKNITQSDGVNNFLYMPNISPWKSPTGIFSPLQYATGACLAMAGGGYAAYFKGNEWYVSNSGIGQMLRGEVHRSRGVHVSGATTAGNSFDLNISGVSGKNDTANNYNWKLERGYVSGNGAYGSWKYGHDEDAALRAVSSCDMHESAFGYDGSNNITGYNGSAFKAGDEFPQSATEAIETVTANSGAWGGSALPISAGPGIGLSMIDGVLVISVTGGN